jgi:hypothetical protein
MSIQHFLVVVLVALAVPLQSAIAACQCFKETPDSPSSGYLALEPTDCTTTPSGFGWLKVAPDGNGDPNPPMYVALRSSRTFNGCSFIVYNGAWPNGPSKVLLSYFFGDISCNNPPSLVFDFQPPDSTSSTTDCSDTVSVYGDGTYCAAAKREAQSYAEAYARDACASGVCAGSTASGSFTWSNCLRDTYTYPYPWMFNGAYTYYCTKTENLCQ